MACAKPGTSFKPFWKLPPLEIAPGISLGVCGEHGGDPKSVEFFDAVGVDYVSCSPYRVVAARLAAGRAAVERKSEGEK